MIQNTVFTNAERDELLSRRETVLQRLLGNVKLLPGAEKPVLMVGAYYPGIWLEHNQDCEFLAEYDPEGAWASQEIFMRWQREDGLIPYMFRLTTGKPRFTQIQCVRSFTRCALEVARKTARPSGDFLRIYQAGCRYDQWLSEKRGRSGRGLIEMYCEFDTGHDNAPRVKDGGIPHACPGDEAANMPDLPCMPILSVDLSAMCYGGRVALAELAELLGRPDEAEHWRRMAVQMREAIRRWLYDPEDDFYYDRSPAGFRKYRTEHLTRLFLNGVVSQEEFDRLYDKWMDHPDEFRTAFPFPAVSVSDPHFDRNCPPNSWASNSQALTAERALLWLRAYGREEERTRLLLRWLRSVLDYGMIFPQELNPFTGVPIGTGRDYTPSLILFLEGLKILA